MASIFLKGKKWYVQTCTDGVKKQISLRTSDKKIAQYRKNEIENQIALGESPIFRKKISAIGCFEAFKQSREGILTANTQRTDHHRLDLLLQNVPTLAHITEQRLKDHLDARIKAGISHRTANHTIRAVKTFLSFCVRNKHIKENPIRFMRMYPIDQAEPRFLSSTEVKLLIDEAKNSTIYPLILTAIYTGMRFGELDRLRWEDVNWEDNTITIMKSKTKKFRKIPIHPEWKAVMYPMRGSGSCFKIQNHKWIDRKLTEIRGKLEIHHFRFHDLRHTFASLMIKGGVDLLTVSKFLGHSNTRTTEIYAHLYQDHTQDAMKKFCL